MSTQPEKRANSVRTGGGIRPHEVLLLGAFVIAGLMALVIAASQVASTISYQRLRTSERAAGDSGDTESETRDWEELLSTNPECVGWLEVEGTTISYPVVQPGAGKARTWYLTHDFWGNLSSSGVPYLDQRADADGMHLLLFAHRVALGENLMFGPVRLAWQQETFDGLGSAVWSTPDGQSATFVPLCALKVDEDYQEIQTFSWESAEQMREWLLDVLGQASAASSNAEELATSATKVMTLVTCSSTVSGQRWRTLTIFVEISDGADEAQT